MSPLSLSRKQLPSPTFILKVASDHIAVPLQIANEPEFYLTMLAAAQVYTL